MPHDISIDDASGIAVITMHGTPRFEEFVEILEALTREGGFRLRRRLWDLRGGGVALTSTEVRQLAEKFQQYDSDELQRLAIVSSEDLAFGLARMYEAYRASDQVEVRVFRNLDKARSWLEEDF